MNLFIRWFVTGFVFTLTAARLMAETGPLPDELTLPHCLDLALKQNPALLKSQQELRRTRGLIVEARSYILPHLTASGDYAQIDPAGIDRFPFGTNATVTTFKNQERPWSAQIEATQLIYSGGRVTAGIRAAKLADRAALLDFHRVVSDTVLEVRRTFYGILLARQQVVVREQSVQLLEQQLQDTRHRYEAGTVPQFNVLRAEVELANAKPPLIRARNELRLGRETLVRLLALDRPDAGQGFTPVNFAGQLTHEPGSWDLPSALAESLAKRPELRQAEKQAGIAAEEIKIAQSGYKPEISIFGNYRIYDSTFGDELDDTVHGWTAGARATWPLFDGLLAKGRIAQARARREQTAIDLADTRRAIELEVRQAYSDYVEAVELLDAQKKTVEQAAESLRLAEARFRTGTGTQLDVLSAQTALTEARSNEIQALYDYNVALATLERATGRTTSYAP